jgi:hypothetical protein
MRQTEAVMDFLSVADFESYLSDRNFSMFGVYLPMDGHWGVVISKLLIALPKDEALDLISWAERSEAWHPDSIALERRRVERGYI